jgi:RNAse (barnase) inhibitor barstar
MKRAELLNVLEDWRRAGIYRLPPRGRAVVLEAAETAGLACFQVSFADADRIGRALGKLGQALGFPDWYGQNLDALKDCLTDLSWCQAPGYVLIILRAETLYAEDSVGFQALNEVFAAAVAEWRSQACPMWVFYDLPADELATLATPG